MNEIFDMGHEQVLMCHYPASGYRAIIALHSTALGPAVGGTRLRRYESTEEALADALRLSRGMTYKNAVAGLAMGGGKAVIMSDGTHMDRTALFRTHGRVVEQLNGRFITAEDVGTYPDDFAVAATETRWVAGFEGRGGDPSPHTARGVVRGIEACALHVWGSTALSGRRVAVQGCGAVGSRVARALAGAGAQLILADVDTARASDLATRLGARVAAPDEIYRVDADIFCPCALGAVLNDDTINVLSARIVAGAANNQLQDDRHADALDARGILYAPDFVINAGGVISGSVAILGEAEANMLARVDRIHDTLLEVFDRARTDGCSTARAAESMAEAVIAAAIERRGAPPQPVEVG